MRLFFCAFIFSCLFFLSCDGARDKFKPYNIESISDKENNDRRDKANTVNIDEQIIGFFNKKNKVTDVDYYKIIFRDFNTGYKIVLTAVPAVDSRMTFFSMDGKVLFGIDNSGKGEAEKLWEYYPRENTLIIKIEAKTGFNEVVPYFLNFIPNREEERNEIEPNDSKETAMPIKIDRTYRAMISPIDDIDFYKITFDDNKTFDFSIEVSTYSDLDLNFNIIDEKSGKNKFINNSSWGGKEIFPFLSSSKGDYFIKVTATAKNYQLKMPTYQIMISTLPEKKDENEVYYEREFNDIVDYATVLLDSSETQALLFPTSDTDWFQFDVFKTAHSVNIDIDIVNTLQAEAEIYDSNMTFIDKLKSKKGKEGKEILMNQLKKGRYYLKISSKKSSLSIYKIFLKVRYM